MPNADIVTPVWPSQQTGRLVTGCARNPGRRSIAAIGHVRTFLLMQPTMPTTHPGGDLGHRFLKPQEATARSRWGRSRLPRAEEGWRCPIDRRDPPPRHAPSGKRGAWTPSHPSRARPSPRYPLSNRSRNKPRTRSGSQFWSITVRRSFFSAANLDAGLPIPSISTQGYQFRTNCGQSSDRAIEAEAGPLRARMDCDVCHVLPMSLKDSPAA